MAAWLFLAATIAADSVVGDFNPYLYPSKTGLIAVIDLQVAKNSGYFDDRLKEGFNNLLQGNEQLKQLSELLDFDPLEQLTNVTICGSDQQGDRSFLMIVNGNFPFEKLSEALTEMVDDGKLSVFNIEELTVYFNHREREAMYFALIDGHTVIATPSKTWMADSVSGLVNLRKMEGELAKRSNWKEDEPKQALRLAGIFPEDARRQIGRNPQLAAIAEKLVGYNVSVQLLESPRIQVRLTMTDPDAADQAALLFNTLVRFGEAALANSPRQDLLQLLQKLKIDPKDADVLADVTMSGDLFRQILQNNEQQREQMRQRRRQREAEQNR